jgi:biotin carboxyl carrier protein
MAIGKAVNLRVRPVQSADLCYPIDGTILFQPDQLLGKTVQRFDLDQIYPTLGTVDAGDPSRLVWSSYALSDHLRPHLLSALRAEHIRADLDQAFGMRQNAYITTYSDQVVDQARRVYYEDPSDPPAVLFRLLTDLEGDTSVLHGTLQNLYIQDGVWGNAVKKTKTDTTFSSVLNLPGLPDQYQSTAASSSESAGYEYRLPSVENDIRFRRARIAQRQEFLAAFRMRQMCERSSETFANELAALDQQIRKLQVAYIDTMLVPPFGGIVTGVFRNPGDFVTAGQPVLRIEADDQVYLVGTIKSRGLVRVNDKVTVTTTLFDAPGGQPTKIDGVVSSVRGHDSVDEQWDVLVLCSNRTTAGEPILPLNYNFDFESTTVAITGA